MFSVSRTGSSSHLHINYETTWEQFYLSSLSWGCPSLLDLNRKLQFNVLGQRASTLLGLQLGQHLQPQHKRFQTCATQTWFSLYLNTSIQCIPFIILLLIHKRFHSLKKSDLISDQWCFRSYLHLLLQPRHADDLWGLLQLQLSSSPLGFHLERSGGLGGHVSLRLVGQLALWAGWCGCSSGGQGSRSRLNWCNSLLGGKGWTFDGGRVRLARNCGGWTDWKQKTNKYKQRFNKVHKNHKKISLVTLLHELHSSPEVFACFSKMCHKETQRNLIKTCN